LPTISTADRDRHVIFVAGEPRQLTPQFWRLFTSLYSCRGGVVPISLLRLQRQNLSSLRKLLAGSRYQIVNRKSIGCERIVTHLPAERSRRRSRATSLPSGRLPRRAMISPWS
jgi:hypothetical protein